MRYLGVPISDSRIGISGFGGLKQKMAKRPDPWRGKHLSSGGKLVLTISCLSSLPIFMMGFYLLPKSVHKWMDSLRGKFFWQGAKEEFKYHMASWDSVSRPKDKGGLGVINLRLHNDALLMKHLHKFYNHADIPWIQLIWFKYYQDKVPHASREVGSFWWKDVMRLNNLYRSCSRCIVGDGSTVCFWEDRWTDNILSTDFPRIASFSKSEHVSVQQVMQTQDMEDMFHLPLSVQALEELNDLQTVIQEVTYDANQDDKWQPLWGINFSARKYYEHIYGTLEAHPIFQQIHKSRCTPRVKFFVWLVLVDRLNTKTMLSRRHICA